MPRAMPAEDIMPSRFARSTGLYIQQGNSEMLRVVDQNKFYVVREERQGSQILGVTILASFVSEAEAVAFRDAWQI